MSRTIHGRSTAALKHLRECPAALAVYWCYVARMNNEGVAWPSGRGLQHDTAWNRASCLNGRELLVKLGALELVKDYVRPEWRELPDEAKAKKLGMDRAEYYRPTGKLAVDGRVYHMLYNGSDEANTIDADVTRGKSSNQADGLPHRPSTPQTIYATDHLQDRPELNSRIHLDSTAQLDSSSHTSAPDGAGTGNKPDKPIRKGKGKVSEDASEAQAVTALIAAWLATGGANGSKIIEPTAYGNTTKRKEAQAMHAEGITPAVVTDYLRSKHTDRFWAGKVISWYTLKGEIVAYYLRNRALYATSETPSDDAQYDDLPMTPLMTGGA